MLAELEGEGGSLGKGGVYLDRCGFGPEGDTSSSPQGKTLSVSLWPVNTVVFINTTLQGGVQVPAQGEEEFGDVWLALNAFCTHPAEPAVPHVTGLRCATRLRCALLPPKASAAGGNSPRAWQTSSSSQGSLLREKQGPYP